MNLVDIYFVSIFFYGSMSVVIIKTKISSSFWKSKLPIDSLYDVGRVIIVILMDRTLNIPHCKESRIEVLINGCAARDSLGMPRFGNVGSAVYTHKSSKWNLFLVFRELYELRVMCFFYFSGHALTVTTLTP